VNQIEATFETQNEFVIETTKKITDDYLMGYEEEFKDRIKQDNQNMQWLDINYINFITSLLLF